MKTQYDTPDSEVGSLRSLEEIDADTSGLSARHLGPCLVGLVLGWWINSFTFDPVAFAHGKQILVDLFVR